MNIAEFIVKYNGKKVDFDNYAGGQCFDLYRQFVKEVLNFPQSAPTGDQGAKILWTGFDKDPVLKENYIRVPNSSDFTPQKNDIMIWNEKAGGGYGHVAICTGINTGLKYFQSFDQNWSKISYCELVNHSYANVYGVLRPKVQSTQESMQVEKKVFEELVGKSTKYDEFEKAGYPDLKSLEMIINSLKENKEDLKKEYDKFILDIVTKLNPTGSLAPVTDKNYALQLIDSLITEKDEIETAKKKLEDESSKREKALEEEIYKQEVSLKSLKTEVERLLKRVLTAESENERLKKQKDENNWFSEFINSIFIKRK